MSADRRVLVDFVRESNRIEGINRSATTEEIDAHEAFLRKVSITVPDLEDFVKIVAGAPLRSSAGMDVRIGNHLPPRGGPAISERLADLLLRVAAYRLTAWEAHVEYETLHPFMDGNGRSGRALWLWMMRGHAPLGFLHKFYYQTLDNAPGRIPRPTPAANYVRVVDPDYVPPKVEVTYTDCYDRSDLEAVAREARREGYYYGTSDAEIVTQYLANRTPEKDK